LNPKLRAWAEPRCSLVDTGLIERFSATWPAAFGDMCRYPILTGGKRMRPLLVFAAYEATSSQPEVLEPAIAPALAIELIHTYSLVHDDLPCMDDDSERRGKPTVHVQFGEGPAVLVGDTLLTEAFSVLATADTLDANTRLSLIQATAKAAGHLGMIGGQAADLGLGGAISDAETLTRLHRAKTGALIQTACTMGAMAAGASPQQIDSLTRFGNAIGLAFQLADDLLDLEQDSGEDGPPSFPALLGVEETQRRAENLRKEAMSELEDIGLCDGPLNELAQYTLERTL